MPFKIFWSLSVEEHFYLVFPWIAILLKTPIRIFGVSIAVILTATGLRVVSSALDPSIVATHYLYMRTEFRMDAIAYGVAVAAACEIAQLQALLRRCFNPVAFFALGAVALASIVFGDTYFANVWRYLFLGPTLALIIAAIIFSSQLGWVQYLLNLAPARWIGRLSYSLYVWHLPVQAVAVWLVPGVGGMLLAWVLSFAVSAVSYYVVETPVMRLRKRFGSVPR